MSLFGYWTFVGYEKELLTEIQHKDPKAALQNRLVLTEKNLGPQVWAQFFLQDCVKIHFDSISQAAHSLKSISKRWCSEHLSHHRRGTLIQEQVFKYKNKPLEFLEPLAKHEWSFWTLLSKNELLASSKTNLINPLNEFIFDENKKQPPSRAYLKLWELMTVHGVKPTKNDLVLDMGSSPGGWTWVLQQMGCKVLSIDKAELHPNIMKLPRVEFLKKDVFQLKPSDIPKADWFFSDVICEPAKLLQWLKMWKEKSEIPNFVCTIKFKGKTDFKVIAEFQKIPGSKLIHLCHNKHELTWLNLREA